MLIFFGIEEALGLHTWADRHLGVDWNIVYLPFIAIAAVVWFQTASLMKGHRPAQLMFAAGLAGWMVAAVFDAARTGRADALPGGELLEIASAGLLLLGVFTYARSVLAGRAARPRRPRASPSLAIARAAVSRVDIRPLVIGLALLVVLFGIMGAIVYPGGGDLRAFDVNKEQTFPATFSGMLLLAAGGLALLNGLVRSETAAGRRWWIVLALVFAFLGLDEIAALHEAVQDRVHVWGQAALAPIVVAGVYAWWVTLQRLRKEQPAGHAVHARRGRLDRVPADRRQAERALGLDGHPRGAARDGRLRAVRPCAAGRAAPAACGRAGDRSEPARAAVSAGGVPVAAR